MSISTSRGHMGARSVSAPQQGKGESGREKAESLMFSHPDLCPFCTNLKPSTFTLVNGFPYPKGATFQKFNELYKSKMQLSNSSSCSTVISTEKCWWARPDYVNYMTKVLLHNKTAPAEATSWCRGDGSPCKDKISCPRTAKAGHSLLANFLATCC